MSAFKELFGVESSTIQKTCVVVPFLMAGLLKNLGIEKLQKGMLYSTAHTDSFSFIKTGISATLVGDAVLHLEDTCCQEIVYIGSCGLVQKTDQLNIGALVSPDKCFSFESFTDTLLQHTDKITTHYPDKPLLQTFLNNNLCINIQTVCGMSVGSLKCEEYYKNYFIEKDIQVIDMECSAVFSAAHRIKKKAVALLYVTDIIGEKPFYKLLEHTDRNKISCTVQAVCELIKTVYGIT